ncbi:MAG: putative cytosol aminopeptidase [Chlamydiales bacterium]|nr:putative cytosol aminopeptidase [Chlamydiales bacterium]
MGERGECALVYSSGKERRCLLLGLGKEGDLTVEGLRRSYSEAVKYCQKMALASITVVLPNIVELRSMSADEALEGVCEGVLLSNYVFEKLVTLKEETVLLEKVQLVGVLPAKMKEVKRWQAIAEGVYLCRDLINGNADDVTPKELCSCARKIASSFDSVKATIFDKARIKKEKMGLLQAVSKGSSVDPAFIILSHKGAPKSKEHTVLVGKGVTYDTGGLNLKTGNGMETMRSDMGGAAAVLSALATAAALNLKCNVTAVVPTTENAIDGASYKMGDVYTAYNGSTVEIGNTDAEGRLILADALSYTVDKLKPTRIIDLATLTGSVVVALGDDIAGLYSNDQNLADSLLEAGSKTGEDLWQMPLRQSLRKKLKSSVADMRNVGTREGGSITAALFLEHFVDDIAWAHLDIAGTAFQASEKGYWPKNGVGFGVRLLTKFLKDLK